MSGCRGREPPLGGLAGDAPAGAQHITGDCQFVDRHPNISCGTMEDEVFEIDEFAVDPQRGVGIGEVGPLKLPLSDRRTGNALVQTRKSDAGVKKCQTKTQNEQFFHILNY